MPSTDTTLPTRDAAARLVAHCAGRGLTICTVESCTGGMVAAAIIDVPGSSAVLDRGFVTYSNAAKEACVGVPAETLRTHGAVSAETAVAMARGGLAASPAELCVSVTGVAGPGGGSEAKPVGLVHFAVARRNGAVAHRECRFGDLSRAEIRRRSVDVALELLYEAAGGTLVA